MSHRLNAYKALVAADFAMLSLRRREVGNDDEHSKHLVARNLVRRACDAVFAILTDDEREVMDEQMQYAAESGST